MIRPVPFETERYGEYSKAGEFVYDHPFLWAPSAKAPDLGARRRQISGRWHYNHMDDPRATSPGSIMPRYSWLLTSSSTRRRCPRAAALRRVGVPYPAGYENGPAQKDLQAQAEKVVADLKLGSITAEPDGKSFASSRICNGWARTSSPPRRHHLRSKIINRRINYGTKVMSGIGGVGIYESFPSASSLPFSLSRCWGPSA